MCHGKTLQRNDKACYTIKFSKEGAMRIRALHNFITYKLIVILITLGPYLPHIIRMSSTTSYHVLKMCGRVKEGV
jgi:hypothetical protein